MSRWMIACIALAVCVGCDDSSDADAPTPDAGMAGGTIGPEGGSLTAGGAQLTVPAGALAEATALTVSETAAAPVGPWQRLSPVYRFGPAGTTFAAPVTVRIAFTGGGGAPTLFWTEGDGFVALPGARVDGDAVVAEVTHFSEGFVGVPGAPDGGPTADGGPDAGPTPDGGAPGDATAPPADAGAVVDAGGPPGGGPLQPSVGVALGSEQQHDLSLKRALPAPGGQVTALFT